MTTYTIDEAKEVINRDIFWLREAGFLDEEGYITKAYQLFMQGKLNLSVNTEINVLRRLERLEHLSHEVNWAKTAHIKFGS